MFSSRRLCSVPYLFVILWCSGGFILMSRPVSRLLRRAVSRCRMDRPTDTELERRKPTRSWRQDAIMKALDDF